MGVPYAFVTATFKDTSGNPRASIEVLFEPLSTPYAADDEVATSTTLSVTTDEDGQIEAQKLLQGDYRVVVSDADAFTISVPGDSGTHDIGELTVALPAPSSGSSSGNQVSAPNVQGLFNKTRNVVHHLEGDDSMVYDKIAIFGEGPGTSNLWNTLLQFYYQTGYILCVGNTALSDLSANLENPPEKFYDCLGTKNYNGDLDDEEIYTEYFSFPPTPGGERYYKAELHHSVTESEPFIDLFVINSNPEEGDGNTQTSVQGNWLRTQLAASTARWKFVMFNQAPFASKAAYSFPGMDWPFAEWGADAVFCGGAKFYERLEKNGIPYFVVGTFADTPDTIGTPIVESRFTDASKGFLTCEFNEYSLRFYFVRDDGNVVDLVEKVHKDTNRISSNVVLAPAGGIVNTEMGISLDYGVADGKVQSHFSDYMRDSEGRLIYLDTAPSPEVVRANGWLKKCLFVVGDDPPAIYYWNKASSTVELWLPSGLSSISLFGGTRTQLAPPSFNPVDGTIAVSTLVFHIDPEEPDPDVVLWVSINGSDFGQQGTNPARLYFGSPKAGKTVIAAFASKVGFIDSEISFAQFGSLSDTFRFGTQI